MDNGPDKPSADKKISRREETFLGKKNLRGARQKGKLVFKFFFELWMDIPEFRNDIF